MLLNNKNNLERVRESGGKLYMLKQIQDRFGENNILSKVTDGIIPKPVKGLFKYRFHERLQRTFKIIPVILYYPDNNLI